MKEVTIMLHIQKLNRTIFNGFGILLAAVLALPAASQANNLNISQTPLSIGGLTEPDVMFTIDDSGSMGWEAMPDAIANIRNTSFPSSNSWTNSNTYSRYYDPTSSSVTQIRSPNINTIFYNPAIRYYPWSNSNGSLMANADPTCAQYDPMAPNATTCVNFTIPHVVGGAPTGTLWPADYYIYNGGGQTTASNYTHVVIQPGTTYTTSANRTDCASAPTCTFTEEVQNYANWFQYYRERLMTAKAGISRAFAAQPTSMRVGYGSINTTSHTVDGVSTRTVISGVRHFDGVNRTNFFTNLFNQTTNGSTPLRQALEGVGQYFKRTDNAGPWGNTPGDNTDNTPHSTCRQVFNILMTDGYWNGNNPNYVTGNVDNSNGPTITMPDGSTYQYTAANPYKDSYSVTLADVAMYYWNHDLRTDLANNVPSISAKDPAKWQHLVNFTVGLGVQGTLDSDPNSPT
ncbi:MAG TPA: hypothetical protein VNI58_01445, partial [Mariprofundaceae bacterium]|nr:hypothetical protein [Mariprofundaceae bacterium]